MNFFKSHFRYNKRQRNGIFFLLLIIVILQIGFFFVDFSSNKNRDVSQSEFIRFKKEMDSLRISELEKRKPKTYPFNPNFITDYKGYQLGMSVDEIDRLLNFRTSGKYVNSTKEFQALTKVSDSLLNNISPYFKFPDWVNLKKESSAIKYIQKSEIIIKEKDLNLVDSEDLIQIRGIGVKLAKRILDYRAKLQGFSFNDQLYEVWYLDKEVANEVLKFFKVIELPKIKKLNINTATFKEVLAIAYIDYELTKKIFNFRDEVAEIQSLDELKKIDGFPIEKFGRISLYLVAE